MKILAKKIIFLIWFVNFFMLLLNTFRIWQGILICQPIFLWESWKQRKNIGTLENSKWTIWKKKVSGFDQPLVRVNLTTEGQRTAVRLALTRGYSNPETFFFQIVHFEFSRLPMFFRYFQLSQKKNLIWHDMVCSIDKEFCSDCGQSRYHQNIFFTPFIIHWEPDDFFGN
jgi:hypothetical protein